MLPPLVSHGDVVVPCKPKLGWLPLAIGEGPCVVKLNIMGITIRLQTNKQTISNRQRLVGDGIGNLYYTRFDRQSIARDRRRFGWQLNPRKLENNSKRWRQRRRWDQATIELTISDVLKQNRNAVTQDI